MAQAEKTPCQAGLLAGSVDQEGKKGEAEEKKDEHSGTYPYNIPMTSLSNKLLPD